MRIHFNKFARQITVHHSNKCHLVDEVEINVPCRMVYRPEKKQNPRCWIDARGILTIDNNVAIISGKTDE